MISLIVCFGVFLGVGIALFLRARFVFLSGVRPTATGYSKMISALSCGFGAMLCADGIQRLIEYSPASLPRPNTSGIAYALIVGILMIGLGIRGWR